MTDPDLTLSRESLDALIFDLDGVVTRTAEIHAAAWKRLFDTYLSERTALEGENPSPFDIDRDYRRYVDGRPRYQGVRHFLLSRYIDLPMGEPDDPPERESICGLGNRKNQIFREVIREQGVAVYDCAVALVRRLRAAGIKTAVVSESMNCRLIMEGAGVADLFDVHIDGIEAERLELDGKPDPDTFLEAARRLGVDPERAGVVEDAIAGVTAARRGRFALVIGVDRGGQREALSEHGADLVLEDLCRIAVEGAGADDGPVPADLTAMALITDQLADRRPALLLDFDGTLAPIVERPEDARLSEGMRRILGAAARAMPVAVISGRDLADLRRLTGLSGIVYAGSHGLEIEGPDLRMELPEAVDALDDLDHAAQDLAKRMAPISGVRLERRRFAIAVHYRQVADASTGRVELAVDQVRARYPRLLKTGGNKLFELHPDIDWDKGRAVRWLLSRLGLDNPDVLPIYIGDDLTDEDAFSALRGLGIGILVAARAQTSAAAYRLRDTAQVELLLRHLVETETGDG